MSQPQMTNQLPPHVEKELKIYMGKILNEIEAIESDDLRIGHLLNEIATWKIFMLINGFEQNDL
jgi:hypothetical protein